MRVATHFNLNSVVLFFLQNCKTFLLQKKKILGVQELLEFDGWDVFCICEMEIYYFQLVS